MSLLLDTVVLGQEIRERRKARGLTQKQAAKAAGVAQSSWSIWEAGRFRPNMDHLAVIAKVVGARQRDLLLAGSRRRRQKQGR